MKRDEPVSPPMLPARPHDLILRDRKSMTVSGVLKVERFDEQEAIVATELGTLLVRGSDLHLEKLSLETGEIALTGTVTALEYEEPRPSGGILARLLR